MELTVSNQILIDSLYKIRDLVKGINCYTTISDVEEELIRSDQISNESERLNKLQQWRYQPRRTDMPKDPFSADYRSYHLELYKTISGRSNLPTVETQTIDALPQISHMYPYVTRSPVTIGESTLVRGYWLKSLELAVGSDVVEMGSGQGQFSTLMALAGFNVTAVDIHEGYNKVACHLAEIHGTQINTSTADMLEFEPKQPVDAVVFCESFHHCDNPNLLIERVSKYVKPTGRIFFFGEPITVFPVPWGVRLDGQSIWAARKHGWLELGFNTAFFKELLNRHGWQIQSHKNRILHGARVTIAKRG